MKIFKDNTLYIQKNDIAFIHSLEYYDLPYSVLDKILNEKKIVIDSKTRFDFVKFTDYEAIHFFNSLPFLLDYDEVSMQSEDEIISLAQNISKEKDEVTKDYCSKGLGITEEKMKLIKKYELLDYKMHSIIDYLLFLRREISYKLPNNIDYPYNMKDEPKIKRLFKKMFLKST